MFIINLLRIQPQQIETTLSNPKCIVLRSQGLKTVHALGQRRHMKRKVFKLFCSMLQNISHYFLRVKNYLHSWREPHANVFSFSLVRVLEDFQFLPTSSLSGILLELFHGFFCNNIRYSCFLQVVVKNDFKNRKHFWN